MFNSIFSDSNIVTLRDTNCEDQVVSKTNVQRKKKKTENGTGRPEQVHSHPNSKPEGIARAWSRIVIDPELSLGAR